MIIELYQIENKLFSKIPLHITNTQPDLECEEYSGYNFQLGTANIKFRKAKITPKKIGQFVTLWRRNMQGITEPFHIDDDFDFYIIYVEKEEKSGFFLFSKRILAEKQILTNGTKDGKRGFRVYPNWDVPGNKQAEKAKVWQSQFFVSLYEIDNNRIDQLKRLLLYN